MEDLEELEKRLRAHVETQDTLLENRLKLWIMSAIVLQLIPLITIAFFIGGIYQNLNSSVALVQKQQDQLVANARWMQERQQWELTVELWGAQLKPPLHTPRQAATSGSAPQ